MKWFSRSRLALGLALILTATLLFCVVLPGCSAGQGAQTGGDAAFPIETPVSMPTPAQSLALDPLPTPTPEPGQPSASMPEPPFTLIWMSDTQLYCQAYPDAFMAMSEWTLKSKERLNTKYILHTGDVVHKRDKEKQWANAITATYPLMDALPFFVIAGNHDARPAAYEEYVERYGAQKFATLPSATGFYKEGVARYDLFDVGPRSFIIVGLGFYHDAGAVAFVNEALRAHPERTAIVCFHSYLDTDGTFTKEGEKLQEEIVLQNPNIRLVLCGHQHGVSKRSMELDDDGDGAPDRTVLAMLADYQGGKEGGQGYLRILEFRPEEQALHVRAYSPYLDIYIDDEEVTVPFAF